MFETCTEANLNEPEDRRITYSCEPVRSDGDTAYWRVRRRCTHVYSYEGLTEDAAKRCAEEIRRSLTRRYARWTADVVDGELRVNHDYILEATSTAQAKQSGGSMWRVEVSIDDNDEIISDHDLKDVDEIEQYFALAESRDVFGQKIAITSAKWVSSAGKIYVDFTQTIENLDVTLFRAYFVNGETETEAQVTNASPSSIQIYANENKEFYLVYGGPQLIESRHFRTNDFPQPNITVISTKQVMSYAAPDGVGGRAIYAAPRYEIEVSSDVPFDQTFVSAEIAGRETSVYKLEMIDSSYRYRITIEANDNYTRFPPLYSQTHIRLAFKSVIPLYVDYDFTPTNYAAISSVVIRGSVVEVRFRSDLTLTQIRNCLDKFYVYGSRSGEFVGSVTDWSESGEQFVVKANVYGLDFGGQYFVGYFRASMPNGDDVINYSAGVTDETLSISITSAVRKMTPEPPTVEITYEDNIPSFDVYNLTAMQLAPGEGSVWTRITTFDYRGSTLVTLDIDEPGSMVKLVYSHGEVTVESNAVIPIGG